MLVFTEMWIRVVYDGRVVSVNVEPDDSVRKLKLMLRDADGINLPTYAQHLQRRGSPDLTVGVDRSEAQIEYSYVTIV